MQRPVPKARRTRKTAGAGRGEKSAQRVARKIVRHIHDADLRPGDKYLSEAEALLKHGVSRGTLREALRYLQIQGVIEIRSGPGGGHFVAEPSWRDLASTLALLLQFARAPNRSLIEARRLIEPGMAELAAKNATPEDVARMDAALAGMDEALGDYDAYYAAYTVFWDAVADSTANPFFRFLSPTMRRITRAAGVIPNERERADALRRVRLVRDAIAAADLAKAREMMTDLEAGYEENLLRNYPRQMERTVVWSDVSNGEAD